MAIKIVEYAFISAKQNAVWENGRCFLTIPHYRIIYVKSSSTTPDRTKITFTFPNGKSVDYDADNVILKEYTKEEIMDKQCTHISLITFFGTKRILNGNDYEERLVNTIWVVH